LDVYLLLVVVFLQGDAAWSHSLASQLLGFCHSFQLLLLRVPIFDVVLGQLSLLLNLPSFAVKVRAIQHVLKLSVVHEFNHELNEIAVREDFQVFESKVLVVDLGEQLCLGWAHLLRTAHSFVDDQVGVAAPFVHRLLSRSLFFEFVFLLLLPSEPLLLVVLHVERLHPSVVEFKPLPVVAALRVSLLVE